jgi:hypothetical protein
MYFFIQVYIYEQTSGSNSFLNYHITEQQFKFLGNVQIWE